MRIPKSRFHSITAMFLLTLALTATGSPAWAQGHTPDPYNIVGEYNNQYEPYMYASEATQEGTLPNQNRREGTSSGISSANRFQESLDDLDRDPDEAVDGSKRKHAGSGIPYYRATLDPNRSNRPNRTADDKFFADQRKRSDDYFKALATKDPKKRARMLRELNVESLRASRSIPNFKNSAAAKKAGRPSLDSMSLDDEEPELRSKPRGAEDDDDINPRQRSTTDSGDSILSRSRSSSTSPARRSSSAASRLNSSRGAAPEPSMDSLSSEDFEERSERLQKLRNRAGSKPSTDSTRRSGSPRASTPDR